MHNVVPAVNAIRDRCAATRHPQHKLVAWKIGNGRSQYRLWCDRCRRCVTAEMDPRHRHSLSKQEAEALLAPDATLDDLPVMSDNDVIRQCYVCDAYANCEDDHVAERSIHGELAEKLPVVPLCPRCHDKKSRNLQAFIQRLQSPVAVGAR